MLRALLILITCLPWVGVCLAQSPPQAYPRPQLTRDASTGTYTFYWWSQVGWTYFLQHSANLRDWSNLPVVEPGGDRPIVWGFASSDSRFFLRLQYVNATGNPFTDDFDGDGFSNYDEVKMGSDPLDRLRPEVDSDGDGIPDSVEVRQGRNPSAQPVLSNPGLVQLQVFTRLEP